MGDINIIITDMPTSIRGCVHQNADCSYTIFLNARLSIEQQHITFQHEIRHILNNDFEKTDTNNIEGRQIWP